MPTVAEAERDAGAGQRGRNGRGTNQATLPIKLTNLSRSLAPTQAKRVHPTTTAVRKAFFSHLTAELYLPERLKMPFSMILTAGNSCRGVERRMAREYRNCAALTKRSSCGRLTNTTVCAW